MFALVYACFMSCTHSNHMFHFLLLNSHKLLYVLLLVMSVFLFHVYLHSMFLIVCKYFLSSNSLVPCYQSNFPWTLFTEIYHLYIIIYTHTHTHTCTHNMVASSAIAMTSCSEFKKFLTSFRWRFVPFMAQ